MTRSDARHAASIITSSDHETSPLTPVSTGTDAFIAFVPRLAVELAADGVPSWTSLAGSMLSADISGFTALSERLAGKGKSGAEEITDLINTCFTALIDATYLYGGEVLKFGGDALLVLFRGHDHERRGADAGLSMQRALHASPAAVRASLTMTVGVADGPFDAFMVGSTYRELLVTGPNASEVIRLEAAAPKGETLVSPGIAAQLPAGMCEPHESGGVLVRGSTGDKPTGPARRAAVDADLSPYVPRQVAAQLEAFTSLGGEHRLVTVGFVMVTGISAELERSGPAAVAAALGRVVDHVVEACGGFGVTVLHTDIAHDGIKFVLCAGAPVSPGDTSDAMLLAALQIAAIDAPFVVRQGVQTGRVFAGFLGSAHRRTYTLMGDPVNTAARMLGKAGDREVVAVATVVADTRSVFVSEQLEPFTVKGKSQPIIAHKVRHPTGRVRRDSSGGRLVGRRRELEVLIRAIGELGDVIELVGTAGVGKTRLLDAAWDAAENLAVYQGSCTPYGAAVPYSVFRPLLRGGTRIAEQSTPEAAGDRLRDIVNRVVPELLPMLPLLAVPFGATVPPTAEADAIDPAFRRMRIHELIVQFLDATLAGPILLVVEDAHWIDDASGELANHLIRACAGRPWAAIITRRPEGSWRIAEAAHVTSLELEPLDDPTIRKLAVATSARALLDRDLDLISARAQGNPLFAVELARAMTDPTAELPDTIEQIIASRLDRLTPEARRLVRIASVLGNQFDEAVVTSMAQADEADFDTASAISAAAEDGTVSPRSSGKWAFNHALYRDTAYEGLPFSQRRHLHRLAATIIEERSTNPAAAAPLLSLHFSEARAHEQAWRYSLMAGVAASAQAATAEAVVAYERALQAARHLTSITAVERVRVGELLGDLYYELGRFDDAARVFGQARRSNSVPVTEVRLIRKIGSVAERQGRPDRAIRWYSRAAQAIPTGSSDRAWSSARADVRLAEAGIRARRDENDACLRLAREARLDAERAGDPGLEALALERIQLALAYLHQPDIEGAGPRALEAYRELDDHSGAARTLINLGIEAYFSSDWSTAGNHYLEALEIAERSGSVVLAATAAINSAEILSDQGHWARAIDLLESALRNYQAVGYSAGIAAATLFAGVAEMRDGRLDAASRRLIDASELLQRLGMVDMLDELDSRQLELDAHAGAATIAECDELAQRFGDDHPCAPRILRIRAMLEQMQGRHESARSTLLSALELNTPASYERALCLTALDFVAPGSPDASEWRREAGVILRALGVEATPPMIRVGTGEPSTSSPATSSPAPAPVPVPVPAPASPASPAAVGDAHTG